MKNYLKILRSNMHCFLFLVLAFNVNANENISRKIISTKEIFSMVEKINSTASYFTDEFKSKFMDEEVRRGRLLYSSCVTDFMREALIKGSLSKKNFDPDKTQKICIEKISVLLKEKNLKTDKTVFYNIADSGKWSSLVVSLNYRKCTTDKIKEEKCSCMIDQYRRKYKEEFLKEFKTLEMEFAAECKK